MLSGVYVRNFMPFGEADLDMLSGRDLLLVYGENGVGKSALFEAVYWCVTGTTVRGVPAMNVIRHGEKSCEVTTNWLRGDTVVSVTRYKSKSENKVSIEIDDEVKEFHSTGDAQLAITELFGDPKLLSLVAFFGRKFMTFSRMSPRDRAELIDVLAKAELWEDARAEAASDVSNFRRELKESEGQLDDADRTLKVEREKLTEAEASLRTARREQQTQLTDLRKREREFKKEVATVQEEIEANVSAQGKHETEVAKGEKEVAKLEEKVRTTKTELGKLDGMISALELPEENECPACGQKITAALRKSIAATIKGFEDTYNALAKDHDEVLAKITKVEDRYRVHRERLRELQQSERQARRDETESSNSLASVQRRIERAKGDDELSRLTERVEILGQDSVPMWQDKLKKARADVVSSKEWLEMAEFWAVGFKQIRFLAMARVAGLLSTLMSQQVKALGFDVDALDCSVWKEGAKKGNTRPEVNLIVTRGEWQDPIEALSEGQTQRVDLACFLAIGQLVKAIEGFDPGFRVLDEPLSGMDDDGKFRTFQLLSDQLDGQRFVIDHDANFQDLFRDSIEVVWEGEVAELRPD